VGPIVRSAEDAALVLEAIAGDDPDDPTAARLPVPRYAADLERSLRGVRVGVLADIGRARVDPEVGRLVEEAIAELGRAGAVVTEVAAPTLPHAMHALGAVLLPEADAALRPLLGERIDRVGVEAQILLELAKLVSARQYLAAGQVRARLYDELRAALAAADVLALPTTPVSAPAVEAQVVRVGDGEESVVQVLASLTGPFNLTGLPALALPCGFTAAGLPASLQLVGRPFGETALLAVGHAYQRETDWHTRRQPE
jgi:aspartyl-tRNA(Asn)/glutamyl-tRNA(Gln) amidotransferase subunit A